MSHRTRHLARPEPTPAPPRFMAREVWERMTATERAQITERTAQRDDTAPEPELTDEDLAVLLPLGRRAAVDNMARRLGLPRTTEEDQR